MSGRLEDDVVEDYAANGCRSVGDGDSARDAPGEEVTMGEIGSSLTCKTPLPERDADLDIMVMASWVCLAACSRESQRASAISRRPVNCMQAQSDAMVGILSKHVHTSWFCPRREEMSICASRSWSRSAVSRAREWLLLLYDSDCEAARTNIIRRHVGTQTME